MGKDTGNIFTTMMTNLCSFPHFKCREIYSSSNSSYTVAQSLIRENDTIREVFPLKRRRQTLEKMIDRNSVKSVTINPLRDFQKMIRRLPVEEPSE